MGLRPLDPAEWLEVDERRELELRAKARLLDEAHDRVSVALPGSEPAGRELFDAVVGHLGRWHPGTLTNFSDGTVGDRETTHPVEAAARLCRRTCASWSAGRFRGS